MEGAAKRPTPRTTTPTTTARGVIRSRNVRLLSGLRPTGRLNCISSPSKPDHGFRTPRVADVKRSRTRARQPVTTGSCSMSVAAFFVHGGRHPYIPDVELLRVL